MKNKVLWFIGGCALSLATVLLLRTLGSSSPVSSTAPAVSAAPATKRLVDWRVNDVASPEYREWRTAVQAADWGVGAVLEALTHDLSPVQKAAILGSMLDDVAHLSPADRRALQERLSSMVLAEDLDADLGDVVGRLFRALNTSEQQGELEQMYWGLDEQLGVNNKAAIVEASNSRPFVTSVMNDAAQPLEARDQAIERAAELGGAPLLRAFLEPDSDPTLRVTALRSMGQHAENTDDLRKTIEAAASSPEADRDSYGRDAAVAARVGASESGVPGKSLVLCMDWKQRVLAAPQQAEDEFVRSLVAGKAFARALLSDADASAATLCIDRELTPLVNGLLAGAQLHSSQLQLLAELATDLRGECELRPVPACVAAEDRRSRYASELARAVLPLLGGTGLEHYSALLVAR